MSSSATNAYLSFEPVPPTWWWTGVLPGDKVQSLPLPNLSTCTRKNVFDYFANGWLLNEILFTSLRDTNAFIQPPPHGLRHPLIFYYGHTAALFINKLLIAGLISSPVNPLYERIFEVGVDEMSWDDMSKNQMQWPSVREVNDYRRQVFNLIKHVIDTHPDLEDGHAAITQDSPLWALFMGFEHERIHFETSSVLIREMPLSAIKRPVQWPDLRVEPEVAQSYDTLVNIPGETVVLGKPQTEPSYGWDNEYGMQSIDVQDFAVSKFMVTNRQFLDFVRENGYSTEEFWSTEGWKWKCYNNTKKPTFWVYSGPQGLHQYKLRTLFEEVALPLDWPVCVNFHEAKAFLSWKSAKEGSQFRLLTEAEHTLLRRESPHDLVLENASGDFAESRSANTALALGGECSVTWSRPNRFGVHDISGNVWDWCEDEFHALNGFKVHRYYEDFSTPCFDGEHQMILGGSFMSTGNEASAWSRFHFRKHFFQHAGFHVVRSDANPGVRVKKSSSKYDDKKVMDQYMLFHFGETALSIPKGMEHAAHFPQRTARLLINKAVELGVGVDKVLDVGCAVGGASFTLAKHFRNVLGVDISAQFIDAANAIKTGQNISYSVVTEGELCEEHFVSAEAFRSSSAIEFRRADACSLPAEYESFDAVIASNLLDRLPNPKSFLSRLGGLKGLVKPGGLAVIGSPFTWSELYTPKDLWLGGRRADERLLSFDTLAALMRENFELVHREELPFMIREHTRKYEYVVSDFSVWRHKA